MGAENGRSPGTGVIESRTTESRAVVECVNLTYAYRRTCALADVSLSIGAGEFCGLVGPNGSGKTTLLEALLGLLEPDRGSVHLFGEPATSFEDGERVGYVAQDSVGEIGMPLTVREVVRMGRYPLIGFGRPSAADERAVDRALEKVGIVDLASRRIGRLSGGQRQRAIVARALAGEADLLALDEPAVGIDADARERFYDLLSDLNREGLTVILIEHDVGLVTERADRLVCLDGEVVYDGGAADFLASDAFASAYGARRRPLRRDAA